MNILQTLIKITQSNNLIKNKDLKIESRPTTPKTNKLRATNLQYN